MQSETIETKRAKLKTWLALHQMSRQDFANKVQMSVTSINGWFANKNIPDKKWQKIKAMFEAEEEKPAPVYRAVAIAIPDNISEQMQKAADLQGLTLEAFVQKAALEITQKILNGEQ